MHTVRGRAGLPHCRNLNAPASGGQHSTSPPSLSGWVLVRAFNSIMIASVDRFFWPRIGIVLPFNLPHQEREASVTRERERERDVSKLCTVHQTGHNGQHSPCPPKQVPWSATQTGRRKANSSLARARVIDLKVAQHTITTSGSGHHGRGVCWTTSGRLLCQLQLFPRHLSQSCT